jgi:sulfite reductase (NADPH) flavoprotein alpha-component
LPREPLRFESISAESLGVVWRAFEQQQTTYRVARVDFPVNVRDAFVIRSGTQALSFDPGNGALLKQVSVPDQDDQAHKPDPPGGEANLTEPIFKAFLNGNPLMHTGTRWGLVGQTVMMCAALCMPVLFITGWMRYWQRRKRRQQG